MANTANRLKSIDLDRRHIHTLINTLPESMRYFLLVAIWWERSLGESLSSWFMQSTNAKNSRSLVWVETSWYESCLSVYDRQNIFRQKTVGNWRRKQLSRPIADWMWSSSRLAQHQSPLAIIRHRKGLNETAWSSAVFSWTALALPIAFSNGLLNKIVRSPFFIVDIFHSFLTD